MKLNLYFTYQICLIISCFSSPLSISECHQVVALQLTEINVPDIVDYRHPVTMSCSYDLGENQLNSVKWYKGNEEFYRLEFDVRVV